MQRTDPGKHLGRIQALALLLGAAAITCLAIAGATTSAFADEQASSITKEETSQQSEGYNGAFPEKQEAAKSSSEEAPQQPSAKKKAPAKAPAVGKTYTVNNKITATLEDGVLTITGSGAMPDYSSSNRAPWYDDTDEVTSIVVSKGVTSIGKQSFLYCWNATSATIASSVTSIGEAAFYCCSSLSSIDLGGNITTINPGAFVYCSSLNNINLGSKIKKIDSYAFQRTGLTSVNIPDSVTSIGTGAFLYCEQLTSIKFGKGCKLIPTYVCDSCSKLNSVTFAEGITEIATSAFTDCPALKAVTTPKSTTHVHDLAFPKAVKITNKNSLLDKYGTNGYKVINAHNITGMFDYAQAYKVLDLVNAERKKKGLSALKMDASLMQSAMTRSAEQTMLFSHTRPNGESCFSINSLMSGENIAMGQSSAAGVMKSWMNSSGHRANILSGSFNSIGIGCFKYGDTYYWAQCFGTKSLSSSASKSANKNTSVRIELPANQVKDDGDTVKFNFSIKPGSTRGFKGQTKQLDLQAKSAGSWQTVTFDRKSVVWKSSNSKVATVDASGKVTLKGIGTCVITAWSKTVQRASVKITVVPKLSYQTHVQRQGWQKWKTNGQMSGTSGKSLRLEGIKINIDRSGISGGIQYRTHIQTYGWEKGWKNAGQMSGTQGKSKRLEAIQIKLTGDLAKKYDVYYRVHAQKFGWMGWAKNGQSAGTAGYSYRLEGIEIQLVEKGGKAPGSTKNYFKQRKKR